MTATCRWTLALSIVGFTLAFAACATGFQDARMLNRGQVEVTGGVSSIGVSAEGESGHVANIFGLQGQVGLDRRFNIGFGYGRFELEGGAGGLNSFLAGPRVGLVEDRLAVAVPFSFVIGEGVKTSETMMTHPTLLATLPLGPRLDFNPSARVTLPSCKGCDVSDSVITLLAGVGIRSGSRLTIRPEGGITFQPGETGIVWTFGVAASVKNR
jgi:hypothetical protein